MMGFSPWLNGMDCSLLGAVDVLSNTNFALQRKCFQGGGSCMLQEPHGEYQHQLASMRI